uniref:Uncharacterized protein n=1 Tax=Amphimedon queenslandica TaxID=400682 RepID=A0A1X7UF40_AMPQE
NLINDLQIRNDVQSLCYVPLVCSMVILVYCKEGGRLPTTLTQLYENFILQTIRRHVKRHDINPHTLGSLSSLPSQLAKPLQEMCQLAYTNLANTRMKFSSHELQSFSEAVKEDYLGLMTTFIDYDEEKYQFLHLSIQEFLASWWIAKHEKTEEVFKDHFDDDHFRMCLRFVAGLTHLDHESYQQYFNKQLDLQCKRKPLFGFETCHLSYFYQSPEIRQYDHVKSDDSDNVPPILLLQLLYESQNSTLCQVLAQSINNHSLCLNQVSLSLFDWLCLSYCINNSNTTWNHLHLGTVSNQSQSVFAAGQTNNSLQIQCKRLEVVGLDLLNDELVHKLLQTSLLHSIHECYCLVENRKFPCCLQVVILEFLNLPQLKVLHLLMGHVFDITDKCTELEKRIEVNSTLQEMKIKYTSFKKIPSTVSIIRGVTRNKSITSLMLHVDVIMAFSCDGLFSWTRNFSPADGEIEQLLKDNSTLQALSLDIPDELLPSSLNIVEVNTPLTAVELGRWWSSKLMTSLLPHIKGLQCLVLHEPYPPHLLFLSHPSLHTLTLPLDTAESAIELFNIVIANVTLKALKVNIQKSGVYTRGMSSSLQDMLKENQTLKYFEINDQSYKDGDIQLPFIFLSSITNGLIHTTSLQQLSVPIPLNEGGVIRAFINVTSQNRNLTELQLNFRVNWYTDDEKETPFNEQVLPAVTNFLQSNVTIKLLTIEYYDNTMYISKALNPDILCQPKYKIMIAKVKLLYESVFVHPSLVHININAGNYKFILEDALEDQKKTLIDQHRIKQPHKPLPIVNL